MGPRRLLALPASQGFRQHVNTTIRRMKVRNFMVKNVEKPTSTAA
jgi:hypothetical protein